LRPSAPYNPPMHESQSNDKTDAAAFCPVHRPDFSVAPDCAERAVGRVLWITAIAMVAEIAAGYLSGSMALLADGWHMATHVAAMGIGVFAYAYMRAHAGRSRFTFGPGKVSYLAGYSSGLLLAGVALAMLFEAAMRLQAPRAIHYDEALVVAVLGFAVNVLCAWLLHGGGGAAHGHGVHGHAHAEGHDHGHAHGHDQNLRAAYLHVLADALTSIAAILALLAGKWAGMPWLDPVMAAMGGVLILRWAWLLVRDSATVLLDSQVEGRLREAVHAAVTAQGACVLDEHLWLLAPGRHALVLSVSTSARTDTGALRNALEALPSLSHVTLDIIGGAQSSGALQQTL
jgi:cation diffusion facilitator family transporter